MLNKMAFNCLRFSELDQSVDIALDYDRLTYARLAIQDFLWYIQRVPLPSEHPDKVPDWDRGKIVGDAKNQEGTIDLYLKTRHPMCPSQPDILGAYFAIDVQHYDHHKDDIISKTH